MLLRLILSLQVFLLIGFSPLALAEDEYWEYTLRPGDSIWKIAKEHTNSVNNWSKIQRLNNIKKGPDRTIPPGTRIKIPVSMLKRQPIPAIVIASSGAAKLVRANGESESIQVGSKLYAGDKVMTADQQSLRLQFADKSELQVLPNTEIVLDKLSYHGKSGMVDTRVRLQQGRVNTWVEKLKPRSRYQIQTPAAVSAVRGTIYRLTSDANQISRTEVTEGEVGVSAGGVTQQVKTGFGVVAEIGKPLSAPVKLLTAPEIQENQSSELQQLKTSWTKLEGAALYRYQLATDAGFNNLLLNRASAQTELTVDNLEGGQYYLRVRGIDPSQLEGLNAVRQFTIASAPAPETGGNAEKIIIPSGLLILTQ